MEEREGEAERMTAASGMVRTGEEAAGLLPLPTLPRMEDDEYHSILSQKVRPIRSCGVKSPPFLPLPSSRAAENNGELVTVTKVAALMGMLVRTNDEERGMSKVRRAVTVRSQLTGGEDTTTAPLPPIPRGVLRIIVLADTQFEATAWVPAPKNARWVGWNVGRSTAPIVNDIAPVDAELNVVIEPRRAAAVPKGQNPSTVNAPDSDIVTPMTVFNIGLATVGERDEAGVRQKSKVLDCHVVTIREVPPTLAADVV